MVPFFYIQANSVPKMTHQISTLGLNFHTNVKSYAVSVTKSFTALRGFSILIVQYSYFNGCVIW